MKMNRNTDRGFVLALLAALVVTIGCGRSGLERSIVTGNVTIDGRPIEMGEIRFIPIKGTKAPMWSAEIIKGQYSAHGRGGVPVGTHRVEFFAYVMKNAGGLDGLEVPQTQQILPPKFNVQSTHEITIEPGSGKIAKDFNLKTSR